MFLKGSHGILGKVDKLVESRPLTIAAIDQTPGLCKFLPCKHFGVIRNGDVEWLTWTGSVTVLLIGGWRGQRRWGAFDRRNLGWGSWQGCCWQWAGAGQRCLGQPRGFRDEKYRGFH